MGLTQHQWFTKPNGIAQLNTGHPLMNGLVGVIPFSTPRLYSIGRVQAGLTPANSPSNGYSIGGFSRIYDATNERDTWAIPSGLMPTLSCTVAVIRRKHDTTSRESALFYFRDPSVTTTTIGSHSPWSDGVVYWDFGGIASTNRLTWSGYSANAAKLDYWTFVAGRRGSAIYFNGVKRASHSTAITRTNSAVPAFFINGHVTNAAWGDLQDIYFLGLWDREWTDAEVMQWYQRPYGIFQPIVQRFYLTEAVTATGGITNVRLVGQSGRLAGPGGLAS
jgi:hypothetical protein